MLGQLYDLCNYSHALYVNDMMGREYNDLPSMPVHFLAALWM